MSQFPDLDQTKNLLALGQGPNSQTSSLSLPLHRRPRQKNLTADKIVGTTNELLPTNNYHPTLRILAIDYGSKKCGLAASDPLRIIATGLETIPTWQLFDWLEKYLASEEVGDLVIGESLHKDGTPNKIDAHVVGFERKFAKLYPNIELHRQDEFYTSKRAMQSMIEAGVPKMKRREKERVDKIAATIILQDFMESRR